MRRKPTATLLPKVGNVNSPSPSEPSLLYTALSDEGARILKLPAEEVKRELLKSHYGVERDPLPPKAQLIAYAIASGNASYTDIASVTGLSYSSVALWSSDHRVQRAAKLIQHIAGIKPITERFKRLIPRAIEVMEEIMNDETVPAGTRLEAANKIIERIYGKPKERVEHEGNLLSTLLERLDQKDDSISLRSALTNDESLH